MGRSERWATDREKKKTLSKNGAGPILYLENDEKFAYSDESHIAILGESGTGKSRRLIIPMILNSLTNSTNKESFVIADPKGEIYSSKGDKPVIIYIILPDETPIYEELAGMLISQLMNHYIYIAENLWSGKLPIRINFCLDELGNIGESISNLPHLLSAGRSRNVRVCMII